MDLIEIKGKINTAICYARVVEDEAIEPCRMFIPVKAALVEPQ